MKPGATRTVSALSAQPAGIDLSDLAEVLDQLAAGAELPQILHRLAQQVERRVPGMLCSILLLDEAGVHLRHGAAPSLPTSYNQMLDGIAIGPTAGSCGTAVYRRERVIVEDTRTDPLWTAWRDLAADHGLRACWSEPVIGRDGKVLGTLALYYREPRRPRAEELSLISVAARLASISIERWRDQQQLNQSGERLRLALAASGLGMWEWDLRSGALHVDERYVRVLGADPATFVPNIESVKKLLHPEDLRRSNELVASHIQGRSPAYDVRTRFRTRDGGWRWVATYGQVTERDEEGRALRLSGTNQDIDEEMRVEGERLQLTAHVQLLMDSVDEGICGLDANGLCTFVNHAAVRLLGWSALQLLGSSFLGKVVIDDSGRLAAAIQHGDRVAARDYRFRRESGTPLTVTCSVSPMERDGRHAGAVLVFSDVTETRELVRRLERQAVVDALTGLPNRRGFEEKLQELVNDAHANRRQHALFYVDLDQFKVINDTCGHVAGDRLLQQLQWELRAGLREGDTLARLGGDEFGVLLVDTPLAQAMNVAEELRNRIQRYTFGWEGRRFPMGASIGVVAVTPQSPGMTEVLVAADAACFVAKEGGRNRVHVSLPDDEQVLRHRGEMQWVTRIREALEENRFNLVFEPLLDLQAPDSTRRHYEILSRMQDGQGGVVMPASFVPAAERYQLMGAVDLHIVQKLLAFLAEQPPELLRPEALSVAVNLSGTSLGNPALLESLCAAIRISGMAPACLMFEITETAAISHLEESVRWIGQLRELGCRFALDDFGSGLSSYAYLKNLPIDYLKIDGAFIRRLDQDALSRGIVASITDIGHQMGLRIVAEHVESDAVLEEVRKIGVDYAQGYRAGRAQPLADLARLLREK